MLIRPDGYLARAAHSPLLAPKVSVSGHVYDIATGRLTTTLDARYAADRAGRVPHSRA
jgi:carbonic anhydrase